MSEEVFDYENIRLIPNKCIVKSRTECDTSIELGGRKFKLPVVPANMQTIIDESLSIYLAENDYFYVMHRFEPEKRLSFVRNMKEKQLYASISVGVKEEEYIFLQQLIDEKLFPEYITIDIAHGHSDTVIKMIKFIKNNMPSTFVIAGNVATPDAVKELEDAGADATKIGIGPGSPCITKDKTGFGTGGWQLAALNKCSEVATKPVISDGGTKSSGDIVKCIRFGASLVMSGFQFAGHEESPGKTVEKDGKLYKEYYGSASEYQKGERRNIEGKRMLVEHKGSITDTLNEMEQDIQSAISYAGGKSLEAIRNVDYVIIK